MGPYRPLLGMTHNQAGKIFPLSDVTFIPLPENSMRSMPAKTIASHAVTVTNEDGADVPFKHNYWAGTKIVTIEMNLHFEPGAIGEPKDVSIGLDPHTFTVDFSPSIEGFLNEVIFSAQASNLDLSTVPDDAQVYLYHINNSMCEIVRADRIIYHKAEGSLRLANAYLSHFSLYGFGFVK